MYFCKVIDTQSVPEERPLARLLGAHNNEALTVAIRVDLPLRVRIYSHGEWDSGHGTLADYGWIEDKKTGEIIWTMQYKHSYYAGGADKNRAVDTSIELARGEYVVHYITDGTHSAQRWSATRCARSGSRLATPMYGRRSTRAQR